MEVNQTDRPRGAHGVLRLALRNHLFPVFARHGFTGPDEELVAIDDIDPAPQALLYHFRAASPPDLRFAVTVNVKSFARPTFTVVGGRIPAGGVRRLCPEELVSPERATADMLEEQTFLQATAARGYAPFRQPLWSHLLGGTHGIESAVKQAAALAPQLLQFLRTGETTPRLRTVRYPRPAARA